MTSTDTAGQVEARERMLTLADRLKAIPRGYGPLYIHDGPQSAADLHSVLAALPADRLACGGGEVEARAFGERDAIDALIRDAHEGDLTCSYDSYDGCWYAQGQTRCMFIPRLLRLAADAVSPTPVTAVQPEGGKAAAYDPDDYRALEAAAKDARDAYGEAKYGICVENAADDIAPWVAAAAAARQSPAPATQAAGGGVVEAQARLQNYLEHREDLPERHYVVSVVSAYPPPADGTSYRDLFDADLRTILATISPASKVQTAGDEGVVTFDDWVETLDVEVIQGEYGFEEGEFTVYPELWRGMYDEGLTPQQAYRRALDAFAEGRREDKEAEARNLARIQEEDAALQGKTQ